MDVLERVRGSMLGMAVCDALGASVEFQPRGSFAPVLDLIGGGPFLLSPGQWTDDTSMALCLGDSLVSAGGFDAADQMQRYVGWYRRGEWSSRPGVCFDIGIRTARELQRFEGDGRPWSPETDRRNAPNGSLMRLAPVPLYYRSSLVDAIQYAGESSRTTHGGALCIDACRFYAALIVGALEGLSRDELTSPAYRDRCRGADLVTLEPEIEAIASGSYIGKPSSAIRSTGYVVDSLEAALWCFWKSRSFAHGALFAANLGDDADTVAAIYGALAGAYYGAPGSDQAEASTVSEPWAPGTGAVPYAVIEQQLDADAGLVAGTGSIPDRWVRQLALLEKIEAMSSALASGPPKDA